MSKQNEIENRKMDDIINDLRKASTEGEGKERIEDLLSEVEAKVESWRKADKGIRNIIMLLIVLLGLGFFFILMMNDRVDILQQEVNDKRSTIRSLQWSDSLLNRFMNITYDSATQKTYIHYAMRGDSILTYKQLTLESDSLRRKLSEANAKVELAENAYDIRYRDLGDKIRIEAPRLDSALLLLKYYRSKLEYDPQEKVWRISVPVTDQQ